MEECTLKEGTTATAVRKAGGTLFSILPLDICTLVDKYLHKYYLPVIESEYTIEGELKVCGEYLLDSSVGSIGIYHISDGSHFRSIHGKYVHQIVNNSFCAIKFDIQDCRDYVLTDEGKLDKYYCHDAPRPKPIQKYHVYNIDGQFRLMKRKNATSGRANCNKISNVFGSINMISEVPDGAQNIDFGYITQISQFCVVEYSLYGSQEIIFQDGLKLSVNNPNIAADDLLIFRDESGMIARKNNNPGVLCPHLSRMRDAQIYYGRYAIKHDRNANTTTVYKLKFMQLTV